MCLFFRLYRISHVLEPLYGLHSEKNVCTKNQKNRNVLCSIVSFNKIANITLKVVMSSFR